MGDGVFSLSRIAKKSLPRYSCIQRNVQHHLHTEKTCIYTKTSDIGNTRHCQTKHKKINKLPMGRFISAFFFTLLYLRACSIVSG